MTTTRRIQGAVEFPADAPASVARQITIELRDVSLQDRPSTLVATTTLTQVSIGPKCRVPFDWQVPVVQGRPALSLRVQVDMQAGARHASGDFLSTTAQTLSPEGDVVGVDVPVTRL